MIAEVMALLPPEGTARARRTAAPGAAKARVRRPAESLERLAGEVLGALARRGGLAVSEIAQTIGATPREIARPITWLLGRGAITKTGERRGTRYDLARRTPARSPERVTARAQRAARPASRRKPRRART
jgi:DNA-binding transcriptional ArsR family regulator